MIFKDLTKETRMIFSRTNSFAVKILIKKPY